MAGLTQGWPSNQRQAGPGPFEENWNCSKGCSWALLWVTAVRGCLALGG